MGQDLFTGIKESYGQEVVETVVAMALQHKVEVIKLANLTMAELRVVLARQRRDYGIGKEAFPPQFPVQEPAANVDDAPVHNMGMERICGKVDYRLEKLKNLNAVSISIILQMTQALREIKPDNFRSYKMEMEDIKELKSMWSEKMKRNHEKGSDEKQELAKRKEERRLDILDFLKPNGGPFTDSSEVDTYLAREDVEEKAKRMKSEMAFARTFNSLHSSTILPKNPPLFRIQITTPEIGKIRQKTAAESGEALRALLGKRSNRLTIQYTSFQEKILRG